MEVRDRAFHVGLFCPEMAARVEQVFSYCYANPGVLLVNVGSHLLRQM